MSTRKTRSCKEIATSSRKRCLTIRGDKPGTKEFCDASYKRSKQTCKAKTGSTSSPKKTASPKKPASKPVSPKKTASPKKSASPKKAASSTLISEVNSFKLLMNEYALHVLSDGGKNQDVTVCPQFYHENSGNLIIGLRTFHSVDAVAWKKDRTGIEYRLVRKAASPPKPQHRYNTDDLKLLEEYARHIHGKPTMNEMLYAFSFDTTTGILELYGKTFKMRDALEWKRRGKPEQQKSIAITKKIAKDLLVEYIMKKYKGAIAKDKSAQEIRREASFNNPFGQNGLFPTSIQYRAWNASIGEAIAYLHKGNTRYYYVVKDPEQRMFVILYEALINQGKALLPGEFNFHKTYDKKTNTLTTIRGKYYLKDAKEYLSNKQGIEFH